MNITSVLLAVNLQRCSRILRQCEICHFAPSPWPSKHLCQFCLNLSNILQIAEDIIGPLPHSCSGRRYNYGIVTISPDTQRPYHSIQLCIAEALLVCFQGWEYLVKYLLIKTITKLGTSAKNLNTYSYEHLVTMMTPLNYVFLDNIYTLSSLCNALRYIQQNILMRLLAEYVLSYQ